MDSVRIKLLVPQPAERARLKQRLKELRSAADKDKRHKERERKEREKLQRKAEKLAEKASKKKWLYWPTKNILQNWRKKKKETHILPFHLQDPK